MIWFLPALPVAIGVGALTTFGAHRADLYKRRRAAGQCERCGYDLRSTPDQCPECGRRPRYLAATTRLRAIDHVQLAIPSGGEAVARAFFVGVLRMTEEQKPEPLAARGGCWFRSGSVRLHCGVESPFYPQRKAHVAMLVEDLYALAVRLAASGVLVEWDQTLPDRRRFYTDDPFGNRIEFIAAGNGFSERKQPLVST